MPDSAESAESQRPPERQPEAPQPVSLDSPTVARDVDLTNPRNSESITRTPGDVQGLAPAATIGDQSISFSAMPPDQKIAQADAAALWQMTAGARGGSPDVKTATDFLSTRSPEQIAAIADQYKQAHPGSSLEQFGQSLPEGSARERFLAQVGRQDGNEAKFNAAMLHASLTERGESFFNSNAVRDNKQIDTSIRDTYRMQSAEQLAQMNSEFARMYGKTADAAIAADPNIERSTKDAVAVVAQPRGADGKLNDTQARALVDSALRNHGDAGAFDVYAAGMRAMSPEARKDFMSNGGDAKLTAAFGAPDGDSTKRLSLARELADKGEVTPLAHIGRETGSLTRLASNEVGITDSLKLVGESVRSDFRIGRLLSGATTELSADDKTRLDGFSPEDRQRAQSTYGTYHEALTRAGNATQVAQWEAQLSHPGSHMFDNLSQHRGWLRNSRTEDLTKSLVGGMSAADVQYARQHPEQVHELRNAMRSLGKSEGETQSIVDAYQSRVQGDQPVVRAGADGKTPEAKTPEATLRSALDAGHTQQIVESLRGIRDLDKARRDWTAERGSSLDADVLRATDGRERQQAVALLADKLDPTQRVKLELNQLYDSRSGVGSRFLQSVGFTHSSEKADDIRDRTVQRIAESNTGNGGMDAASSQPFRDLLSRARVDHLDGKATAAEVTSNTAIVIGSAAVVTATGGAATPFLLAIGAGGATKVGVNQMFRGADYSSSNYGRDFAIGSIETAMNLAGPGLIPKALRLSPGTAQIAAPGIAMGLGSGAEAALDWDSRKSTSENLTRILEHGALGMGQGIATAGLFRAAGNIAGRFSTPGESSLAPTARRVEHIPERSSPAADHAAPPRAIDAPLRPGEIHTQPGDRSPRIAGPTDSTAHVRPSGPEVPFLNKNASVGFAADAEQTMAMLPEHLRTHLVDNNVRLRVVGNIHDYSNDPAFLNQPLRGQPGRTNADAKAFYHPADKEIVIVEKDLQGSPNWGYNGLNRVVAHEFGHAVDEAAFFSVLNRPEFAQYKQNPAVRQLSTSISDFPPFQHAVFRDMQNLAKVMPELTAGERDIVNDSLRYYMARNGGLLKEMKIDGIGDHMDVPSFHDSNSIRHKGGRHSDARSEVFAELHHAILNGDFDRLHAFRNSSRFIRDHVMQATNTPLNEVTVPALRNAGWTVSNEKTHFPSGMVLAAPEGTAKAIFVNGELRLLDAKGMSAQISHGPNGEVTGSVFKADQMNDLNNNWVLSKIGHHYHVLPR